MACSKAPENLTYSRVQQLKKYIGNKKQIRNKSQEKLCLLESQTLSRMLLLSNYIKLKKILLREIFFLKDSNVKGITKMQTSNKKLVQSQNNHYLTDKSQI